MLEDNKKSITIIAIIIIVVILIITSIGLLFFFRDKTPELSTNNLPPRPTTTVNITNTNLPDTNGLGLPPSENKTPGEIQLEKEKQFISSYYQESELIYAASNSSYNLPIQNIKETVINYRDFSRRYDPDTNLDFLINNGFAVVNNPLNSSPKDWQNSFKALKDQGIPVLVTADAVAGLYQDTLDIIYKEIEPDKFYPSLWKFLRDMQNQVKARYESRRLEFGIETDVIAEANRLELSYLTVALKLLQPDDKQVRETIGTDKKYFSAQEKNQYNFQVPTYLRDQVEKEIDLINQQAGRAKSPIFLYEQSYTKYKTPEEYKTSERLKNYYLATTWLQDKHFPVFNQEDNCPECLLDEQDHTISFVAGLYLAKDLAENQEFKNAWANIYKSIAFFRGLESDLTYLDYQAAMIENFGDEYDLSIIFDTELDLAKEKITQIQNSLDEFEFFDTLGSRKNLPQGPDLRLLRDYYRIENAVFDKLNDSPTALNIFSILGNTLAQDTIINDGKHEHANYNSNRDAIIYDMDQFTQKTWHDNAYLSLLSSLTELNRDNLDGFPAFMQTPAWEKKVLNTTMSTWANTHRPIVLEKISIDAYRGFEPSFLYGYIEPQPEFYNQLLSTVRMITKGFGALNIIEESERTYHRLIALENILEKVLQISIDQLENKTLTSADYDFINNFYKEIRSVTGDIKPENLENVLIYQYYLEPNRRVDQFIDGFKYIIAVYPNQDGELIMSMGPILDYVEGYNGSKVKANWQKEINL